MFSLTSFLLEMMSRGLFNLAYLSEIRRRAPNPRLFE